MLPSNINYHISRMPLSPFFIKGAGVQNIPFTGVMGPALHLPALPGPREQLSPAHGGGHQHLPDLFLYSMSKPVMMLFPSNRCVHRKFMLRAFTSRISSSGGSGGSWGDTGGSGAKARGDRERKTPGTVGPREALPHPTPRVPVPVPSAACSPPGFGDGQRTGARTLDGELDQASVFTIRVDRMTGEEDRVPAVSWFQLGIFWGEERSQLSLSCPEPPSSCRDPSLLLPRGSCACGCRLPQSPTLCSGVHRAFIL